MGKESTQKSADLVALLETPYRLILYATPFTSHFPGRDIEEHHCPAVLIKSIKAEEPLPLKLYGCTGLHRANLAIRHSSNDSLRDGRQILFQIISRLQLVLRDQKIERVKIQRDMLLAGYARKPGDFL